VPALARSERRAESRARTNVSLRPELGMGGIDLKLRTGVLETSFSAMIAFSPINYVQILLKRPLTLPHNSLSARAKFKKGALIERSCDLAEPRCVVGSPIARTQVAADSAPQTSEQYFSPSDTSRQRVRLDTARLGTPLAPHVSSSPAARTGRAGRPCGGWREGAGDGVANCTACLAWPGRRSGLALLEGPDPSPARLSSVVSMCPLSSADFCSGGPSPEGHYPARLLSLTWSTQVETRDTINDIDDYFRIFEFLRFGKLNSYTFDPFKCGFGWYLTRR
jgi:hypothetical protein